MKKILSLLFVFLTGCASLSQELVTEVRKPDGSVESKRTTSSAFALWDTKQVMDGLKVTNGKSTHAIGITGADQEAGGNSLLPVLEGIINKLK